MSQDFQTVVTPPEPAVVPAQRKFSWKLIVTLIGLIALFAYYFLTIYSCIASDRLLKKTQKRSARIDALLAANQNFEPVFSKTKELALDVIGAARSVEDVPPMDEKRIVSKERYNRTMIWVPEGEHSLVIRSVEKSSSYNVSKEADLDPSPQQKWEVPLPGPGIYMLKFSHEKAVIHWQLTSNRSDYKAQKRQFEIKGVKNFFGTETFNSAYHFPNEVELDDQGELVQSRRFIAENYYFTKLAEKQLTVRINAEIVSSGRPCLSYEAYHRLPTAVQDSFLPSDEYGRLFLREGVSVPDKKR